MNSMEILSLSLFLFLSFDLTIYFSLCFFISISVSRSTSHSVTRAWICIKTKLTLFVISHSPHISPFFSVTYVTAAVASGIQWPWRRRAGNCRRKCRIIYLNIRSSAEIEGEEAQDTVMIDVSVFGGGGVGGYFGEDLGIECGWCWMVCSDYVQPQSTCVEKRRIGEGGLETLTWDSDCKRRTIVHILWL